MKIYSKEDFKIKTIDFKFEPDAIYLFDSTKNPNIQSNCSFICQIDRVRLTRRESRDQEYNSLYPSYDEEYDPNKEYDMDIYEVSYVFKILSKASGPELDNWQMDRFMVSDIKNIGNNTIIASSFTKLS